MTKTASSRPTASKSKATDTAQQPDHTGAALSPWMEQQAVHLLQQRGHAWLLQGPSGLGQQALGMALARAWLCEQPQPDGLGCGHCTSCHAINVHTHADLCVLMPETLLLAQGWSLSEKAQKDIDDKKRKPSKEIRVDAMREAIEFAQRTSSRGRGKAILIYPAERMNAVTANALLKTLEEPAGDIKLVLASDAAHQLLPTIRSRCISHTMRWPDTSAATNWLLQQGLSADDASTLLMAAGGRPDDALALAQQGINAQLWQQLPRAALQGQLQPFTSFTPAQAIVALQKVCHDLQASKAGSAPRFFAASSLPPTAHITNWAALTAWYKELAQATRTSEHPYTPGLFLEDLLAQAAHFLQHPASSAQQHAPIR